MLSTTPPWRLAIHAGSGRGANKWCRGRTMVLRWNSNGAVVERLVRAMKLPAAIVDQHIEFGASANAQPSGPSTSRSTNVR